MTLLIIDVQRAIITPALYAYDLFLRNVRTLIDSARRNGIEVIYVRHDDGVGTTLTKCAPDYEIWKDFSPTCDEKIFDKTVNSPFKESGLLPYLQQKGETDLIIAGLQTEYCIDATVKCGFEHGFRIFVPAHANTTFDHDLMCAETTYHYYNEYMWNNRYASCLSIEETLRLMSE